MINDCRQTPPACLKFNWICDQLHHLIYHLLNLQFTGITKLSMLLENDCSVENDQKICLYRAAKSSCQLNTRWPITVPLPVPRRGLQESHVRACTVITLCHWCCGRSWWMLTRWSCLTKSDMPDSLSASTLQPCRTWLQQGCLSSNDKNLSQWNTLRYQVTLWLFICHETASYFIEMFKLMHDNY